MLQFVGWQKAGHDLVTEQQQHANDTSAKQSEAAS